MKKEKLMVENETNDKHLHNNDKVFSDRDFGIPSGVTHICNTTCSSFKPDLQCAFCFLF